MNIYVEKGAYAPNRAHKTDAGLDIRSRETRLVKAHSSALFHTGLHVQLPHGTAGLLVSKSGLNVNHGITSTGLIDEGYTGEIMVKLYNHSDSNYLVNAGDKISQLVVIPVLYEDVHFVDSLDENTERGDKGFGSSGK
jgi:dUTP pyrophosphatase|nr:MAG TPA: dUTPase [Caudoviricetes sp.]